MEETCATHISCSSCSTHVLPFFCFLSRRAIEYTHCEKELGGGFLPCLELELKKGKQIEEDSLKPYLSTAFSPAKSCSATVPIFQEDCLISLGICFVTCRSAILKKLSDKKTPWSKIPLGKECEVITTHFYKAQCYFLMKKDLDFFVVLSYTSYWAE